MSQLQSSCQFTTLQKKANLDRLRLDISSHACLSTACQLFLLHDLCNVWWFWYRQDQLEQIAKKLEGPLVVQKGAKDGISDGTTTIYCEGGGSKRRAGGQVYLASVPALAPLQHWQIVVSSVPSSIPF